MAYDKTNWVNGQPPAIDATHLNKIEQGIYDLSVSLDEDVFLLDQTTPQTIINGIPLLDKTFADFTDIKEFVNKDYVDTAVTSLGARYYMIDTSSGISDYKLTQLSPPSGSEQSVTKTGLADDDYIAGWISPDTSMNKLIKGVYNWHIYAEKTGGTQTLRLYWQLVERKSDNTETVIATSAVSNEIMTSKGSYIIPLTLSEDYTLADGSYVVGKLYADVSDGGSAPDVAIYYDGSSKSHWEIPVNLEIFSDQFLKLDGSNANSDIDITPYNLTVNNISAINGSIKKLGNVRYASEYATGGSGTVEDPWIDGIQEAYDDAVSEGVRPVIYLGGGIYKATHTIKFDGAATFALIGDGRNPVKIITDDGVSFTLMELSETTQAWIGTIRNVKFEYHGTGYLLKNFGLSEMYFIGDEFRADNTEEGIILVSPTLHNLQYNQITDCYILGGNKAGIPLIKFEKPSSYITEEILISDCFFSVQPESGVGYAKGIEVDDGAIDRWAITSCRWTPVGDYPIIDIKGAIGVGGIGGINPVYINSLAKTTANSRLIHFNDLAGTNDKPIKISGVMIDQSATNPLQYGVYIGSGWDNIIVEGNAFPDCATSGVYVTPGANTHGIIKNNIGYNTENSGTAILSGDGTTTSFNIEHELGATPTKIRVNPASPDAEGCYADPSDADATNIVVKFKTAPPSGTDNIKVSWEAEV